VIGAFAHLLAALGSQSVDVFEWAEKDIRLKRLPNAPTWSAYAQSQPKMKFSGWQLAHAVVKADYLVERNFMLPGLALILQLDQIIDFQSGGQLSLVPGSAVTLNDFTRTSLSGRLGQGLSLLFAQQRGYSFVGHLATDPDVLAKIKSLPGRRKKAADFLFETPSMQRMILESKGSFSQTDNDPTKIKSVLRTALTSQVDYWMSRISPAAAKGFAVYSCFRESAGSTPSALIFVDPPGRLEQTPLELPEAWVRRRNYASWLQVMGLDRAAVSLRRDEIRDRAGIELPVIRIAGRRIAVSTLVKQPESGRWLGAGLDVAALKMISDALSGDESGLLAYGLDTSPSLFDLVPADKEFSIFPDGSFFGIFDANSDYEFNDVFLL